MPVQASQITKREQIFTEFTNGDHLVYIENATVSKYIFVSEHPLNKFNREKQVILFNVNTSTLETKLFGMFDNMNKSGKQFIYKITSSDEGMTLDIPEYIQNEISSIIVSQANQIILKAPLLKI